MPNAAAAFFATLLPLLCLGSALHAQSLTAPRLGAQAGTGLDFHPLSPPTIRHQTILDPGSFDSSAVILVRELELRLAEGSRQIVRGGEILDLELRLAQTALGITSQNPNPAFDQNIDPTTLKTVIARKQLTMPQVGGVHGYKIKLPFDSGMSFAFGAVAGRGLVVEFRIHANNNAAWLDYPVDAIGIDGRVETLSAPKACPTSSTFVPNQFSDPARLLPGATNHEHYGFTGAPGAACLGVFGFSASQYGPLPLPIDLGPFGAPGCSIGVSLDWMQSTVADGKGIARFPLAYPMDPTLRGFVFFTQILILDPGANIFGMATSPVLRQRLGGDPEAATVLSLNSATDPVGIVTLQSAPIFVFR